MDTSPEVLIHTQVSLTQDQVKKLCADDPDANVGERISGIATYSLQCLADGGMVVKPLEMRAIEQSIGQAVASGEEILPFIEAGSERAGGKLRAVWYVDPAYEEQLRQMAEFQNRPVDEIVQAAMDEAVDNGWLLGEVLPPPRRVLMTPDDYNALKDILGSDFSNGTELADLVKKSTGATSPFMDEVVPLTKQ
jgi:hypothetical protein